METLGNNQSRTLREYLASELARRCAKNPKYSLRSFAKSLEIDAASLYRILNGKRSITPKSFQKLCERLQLSPSEIAQFSQDHSKFSNLRNFDFAPTQFEIFEVISEWQHLAIMELFALEDFRADEHWIAERLGISIHLARASIERLFRTGFLETKDAQWVLSTRHDSFAVEGSTSLARKRLQRSFLEMAINALDELSMDERDNSGVTIAIDTEYLPQLIKKINQFRKDVAQFAAKTEKNANEVYQMSVALFPLTKLKPKIKKQIANKEKKK